MRTKPTPPAIENELDAILATAQQIGKQSKLQEICTNALLYALLINPAYAACSELEKLGADTAYLKQAAADNINRKATAVSLKSIPHSNALAGLLYLNGFHRQSSLQLLKTIIVNDNTAAARLLKSAQLTLNCYGHISLKTF